MSTTTSLALMEKTHAEATNVANGIAWQRDAALDEVAKKQRIVSFPCENTHDVQFQAISELEPRLWPLTECKMIEYPSICDALGGRGDLGSDQIWTRCDGLRDRAPRRHAAQPKHSLRCSKSSRYNRAWHGQGFRGFNLGRRINTYLSTFIHWLT